MNELRHAASGEMLRRFRVLVLDSALKKQSSLIPNIDTREISDERLQTIFTASSSLVATLAAISFLNRGELFFFRAFNATFFFTHTILELVSCCSQRDLTKTFLDLFRSQCQQVPKQAPFSH